MTKLIKDIEWFTHIQKLKFTYRLSGRTIHWEKESTADHTWCMLVVVDYLLELLAEKAPWKYDLDKLKIYELIVYHDLLEADTWDVDLDPSDSEAHKTKDEIEAERMPIFIQKLPIEIQKIYKPRIHEYEERETIESKFVKLVDTVEAEFQCFFQKDLFENWSREYFIEKREKHFESFPELMFIYEEVLGYYTKEWYFID